MLLALGPDGRRHPAERGLTGVCPCCRAPVVAKCGEIVIPHWAHLSTADCDPWYEPMTEWHRDWQETVPEDRREVVMAPHRADVVTPDGVVVELQHSSISPDEIRCREDHYGRMVWLFDVREPVEADRLEFIEPVASMRPRWLPANYRPPPRTSFQWKHSFEWKHARKSIAACRGRVYLDPGDGRVFYADTGLRIDTFGRGWGRGRFYTREAFVARLNRQPAPVKA